MPSRKSTISGGYDDVGYSNSRQNFSRSRSLTRTTGRKNQSRSRSRSRAAVPLPLEQRQPSFTFRAPQKLMRRQQSFVADERHVEEGINKFVQFKKYGESTEVNRVITIDEVPRVMEPDEVLVKVKVSTEYCSLFR